MTHDDLREHYESDEAKEWLGADLSGREEPIRHCETCDDYGYLVREWHDVGHEDHRVSDLTRLPHPYHEFPCPDCNREES